LKGKTENTASDFITREKLNDLFGDEFLNQTIQGFGYRKPHGFAGDFEIIVYKYQKKLNADIRFQKWDKYLHSQEACKAVLNRKSYFIDIASGPCRDLLELFEQIPTEKIRIKCVEIDGNAIVYAKTAWRICFIRRIYPGEYIRVRHERKI